MLHSLQNMLYEVGDRVGRETLNCMERIYKGTVPLAVGAAVGTVGAGLYYLSKGARTVGQFLKPEAIEPIKKLDQFAPYIIAPLTAMGIVDTMYSGIRVYRLWKERKANIFDYLAVGWRLPTVASFAIYHMTGDMATTVGIGLGSIGMGYLTNILANGIRNGWKNAHNVLETTKEKAANGLTVFTGIAGLLTTGLIAGRRAWDIVTTYSSPEVYDSVGSDIITKVGSALFVTAAFDSANAIVESRREGSLLRGISTGFRLLPLLAIPIAAVTSNPVYTLGAGLIPMSVGHGLKFGADLRSMSKIQDAR